MGKTGSDMELEKGWVDVDVSSLVSADWNYKHNDAEKTRKLAENVKRNGQVETIIIRSVGDGMFEVVNGNHRLDVFKNLGTEKVHAFNMGAISLAAAKRIAVETNETRFQSDAIKLAEVIGDLIKEYDIADLSNTLPFSAQEIDDFGKLLDFNWSALPTPDGQDNSNGTTPLTLQLDELTGAIWLQCLDVAKENGVTNAVQAFKMVCTVALSVKNWKQS